MSDTVQLIEDLTDRALGRTDQTVLLSRSPSRAIVHDHLASAVANATVDEMPSPAGRTRFVKRIVLKLGGFSLTRQRAVNQATIGVVNALTGEIDHLSAELEQERRRSAAAMAASEVALLSSNRHNRGLVEQLTERLNTLSRDHERSQKQFAAELLRITSMQDEANHDLRSLVANTQGRLEDARSEAMADANKLRVTERRLALLKEQIGAIGAPTRPASSEAEVAAVDELADLRLPDLSEVYERFEAHFRPAGSALDQRFAGYVTDLEFLIGSNAPVVDVGTGRGDFLAVLVAAGIPCRGLDMNPEAVDSARARGLDVAVAEALQYLCEQPDDSIGAVTAIHVVEHLPPAVLLELIDEITRVLIPGGMVIFETPNSTNLAVGASSFYKDPTHHRPIHPEYLAFLLHDRGLVDIATRFLNPLPEFEQAIPSFAEPGFRGLELLLDDMRWALKGPQDYATLGRRPGSR